MKQSYIFFVCMIASSVCAMEEGEQEKVTITYLDDPVWKQLLKQHENLPEHVEITQKAFEEFFATNVETYGSSYSYRPTVCQEYKKTEESKRQFDRLMFRFCKQRAYQTAQALARYGAMDVDPTEFYSEGKMPMTYHETVKAFFTKEGQVRHSETERRIYANAAFFDFIRESCKKLGRESQCLRAKLKALQEEQWSFSTAIVLGIIATKGLEWGMSYLWQCYF